MHSLKRLVVEAHRRSLWQVLGVYVLSSWAVLGVTDTLTGVWGLPEWVPPFAFVLLLIGLPVVMATAFVQADEDSPDPEGGTTVGTQSAETTATASHSFLQRHLTWRRALLGGVGAFTLLGLLVGAYFASWTLGVGPVGSLLAAGELEEGDRIVLADFQAPDDDPDLGTAVSDALRIDLLQHPNVRVAEDAMVAEILQRMQAEPGTLLTSDLAREVALRGGMAAVLEGEVIEVGTGYALSATLRSAESGESLAGFRETAQGPDELLEAIDRLSEGIRERAGESLRSIRAGPPLERVTTSSLEALRLYSQANRAEDREEPRRAIELFEEALERDPEFAMAWRRLAAVLNNLGIDRERAVEAATRAYELRERLSERERYLAEAFYQHSVTQDREAAIRAYRHLLELEPDHPAALNNLSFIYMEMQDYEPARELLERATSQTGAPVAAFQNQVANHVITGDLDGAWDTLERFRERFPDYRSQLPWSMTHFAAGEKREARVVLEDQLRDPELPPHLQSEAHAFVGHLALRAGRTREARQHFSSSQEAAARIGADLRQARIVSIAHTEVLVGDPDRGVEALLDKWERGMSAEGLRSEGLHLAGLLATAGRIQAAKDVIDEWEEEVRPEERGLEIRARREIVAGLMQLQEGQPEQAAERLEAARSALSCPTCEAWAMGWALRDAGRLEEAAREWEWAASLGGARSDALGSLAPPLITVPIWTKRRLAPLYEELGDVGRALEHYRELAELWEGADAEFQPRLEEVRSRIQALEGRG